nr:MAG TPA: hypothetical protein [Caudoviricetes sp.]
MLLFPLQERRSYFSLVGLIFPSGMGRDLLKYLGFTPWHLLTQEVR